MAPSPSLVLAVLASLLALGAAEDEGVAVLIVPVKAAEVDAPSSGSVIIASEGGRAPLLTLPIAVVGVIDPPVKRLRIITMISSLKAAS